MKDGFIQQIGSPAEVYNHPNNMFVGGFIGSPAMNFIQGLFVNDSFKIGNYFIEIPDDTVKMLKEKGYQEKTIVLGLRPEDI